MFNFREAMEPLDGRSFSLSDLVEELEGMQARHIGEIPPEFGSRELLQLARQLNWVEEKPNGQIDIRLSRKQPSEASKAA